MAKYQDLKEIPVEKLGFEVNKINYNSFRQDFNSLLLQESMREESKRL